MEQKYVYVTGHKHPDTDSIAAAIGYAFYKRANGIKAIPCRLGKLSSETRYLLKRFGFAEPMLLEDARVKLSEIKLDEPVSITPDKTLYEAIRLLEKKKKQICGVVDDDGRLLGIVTLNDAAAISMGDTASTAKLLKDVSVECINKAISGTIIYRDPVNRTNGKVSVVAMTSDSVEQYKVHGKIVIILDNEAESETEPVSEGTYEAETASAAEIKA